MLPDADRTVSKSPEAIPPRRTMMECASRFPKEHVESIVVGDNFHPMPDAKLRYESAGNELETIAVFRCGRKRYETKQRRDCWRCRTGPCSTARVRPLEAPNPQLEKFLEECHFSDRRLTLYGVRRHSLLLVMKDSLQRRPSRPPGRPSLSWAGDRRSTPFRSSLIRRYRGQWKMRRCSRVRITRSRLRQTK
jgi:hypothetical protein